MSPVVMGTQLYFVTAILVVFLTKMFNLFHSKISILETKSEQDNEVR